MPAYRPRNPPAAQRFDHAVAKPRGLLHPRVQQVGPEHFGVLCLDCAKVRSKMLLANFYGRVLIAPTTVEHTRPTLDAAIALVRHVVAEHHFLDGLVAIERTRRYHPLVQRAFAAAGFETRILHPFVTSNIVSPSIPATKPMTPTC